MLVLAGAEQVRLSRTSTISFGCFRGKTAPLSSSSQRLVIAGGEKLQGFDDPLRGIDEPFAVGVFAQAQQQCANGLLHLLVGDRGLGLGFLGTLVRNSSREMDKVMDES